jgi:O-antigen/teichoic acid export membrane protein
VTAHSPMRPVVINSGRNEFEVASMAVFVIIGLVYLTRSAPTPNSVDELLSPWFVALWKLMLAWGAAVSLVGIVMPQDSIVRIIRAQTVERTGMLLIAAAALAYAVALSALGLGAGAAAIGYAGAYGLAGVVRAVRITYDLGRVRMAVDDRHCDP